MRRKRIRRGSISAMIERMSSRMMQAIAASALVSIVAMAFVMLQSSKFLRNTEANVVAADILEDALEARLDASKFRITGDVSLVQSFSGNVREIVEGKGIIKGMVDFNPEELAALESSERLTGQYADAFNRIVALRAPRNEMVATLAETGRTVRQELSEIMESAYRDGDPVASVYAGRAQESLLLGRLYMERYLLDNRQDDFDRAMSSFAEARGDLEELLTELENPVRRDLATSAEQGIDLFVATSDEVFQLIVERNGARAEMDEIGPRLLASVEAVMESLTAQQQVVGSNLRLTGWVVIALLITASAAVMFSANKFSKRTSKYTTASIDKFVTAMTDLANGKTEIDLGRPPDPGTELGRMADALAIFRDNATQKVELERQQAEQERLQAEELEARKKREEAAEREAQERAENERLALLKRLEDSVGTVVRNATRGDFSTRIEVDFDEESLRNMAEGINQLMQNVEDGVGATGKIIASLGEGDLTELMEGEFEGAFLELQTNTNNMISGLKELIEDISGSAVNLTSSSGELRDTSDVLSKQAEQNAASLEETSAALEQLNASINQVSENVTDANNNARAASDTAKSSSVVAADAAESMSRISEASKEIAKVVSVINDIAFQINLLALNAGVEAARAGEAGRGFSVVASEVRQLAQRAAEAAKEIDDVIRRSEAAVSEGVAKVTDAQASLEQISESVVGVSEKIDMISGAVSEQVNGVGEINNAVAQIDQNTQKQAASFEEVTAASGLLTNEAENLKQSTARFKTGAETSFPTVEKKAAEKPKPAPAVVKAPSQTTDGNLARNLDEWDEF